MHPFWRFDTFEPNVLFRLSLRKPSHVFRFDDLTDFNYSSFWRFDIIGPILARIYQIFKTNAYQVPWKSSPSNVFCQIPLYTPYVNHDVWIILNSHKKYHLVTLKTAKIEISIISFFLSVINSVGDFWRWWCHTCRNYEWTPPFQRLFCWPIRMVDFSHCFEKNIKDFYFIILKF